MGMRRERALVMTALKAQPLQYGVFLGTKILLNLDLRFNSILVEEGSTPTEMGNMELVFDDIGVDKLTEFLQRDEVPRPCNVLFDGTWPGFDPGFQQRILNRVWSFRMTLAVLSKVLYCGVLGCLRSA